MMQSRLHEGHQGTAAARVWLSSGRRHGARDIRVTPVILDSQLPFADTPASLLTLPLGTGCLLDAVLPTVSASGDGRTLIVAAGDPNGWARMPSACRVLSRQQLRQESARAEASDYFLMIEPRYWPACGYHFEGLLEKSREYRGATHALAVGADPDAVREQVECDRDGRIKRVQRLYGRMSWPDTWHAKVLCSVIPARMAAAPEWRSLDDLRAELQDRACFSQDLAVNCDVYDLMQPSGILDLNEYCTNESMDRPLPAGYSVLSPGVVAGRDCRIHPSARIVAPVILQSGATIEEGATVIGPTLLGAGSRIQRRALVARCLVGRDTTVSADEQAYEQVTLNESRRCEPRDEHADWEQRGMNRRESCVGAHGSRGDKARPSLRRTGNLALKRAVDVVASSLGLVILSPLLLLVAILVKMNSRGPVFFAHWREGRGGREFPCLKFRTMIAGAHAQQRDLYDSNELDGPQFKLDHDPRLTSVGSWLRRTNIDELPQLVNVLLGHMSLIGPRPSPFRENQICLPWRRARLSVRPGITGMWQICRGDRSSGDFHQWIYYDMMYVRHFSIWLDFKVLFYTLLTKGGRRRVPASRLVRATGAMTSDDLPELLPDMMPANTP